MARHHRPPVAVARRPHPAVSAHGVITAVGGASLLGYAGFLLVPPGAPIRVVPDVYLSTAVFAAAALLCWRARASRRGERWAWRLIAVALTLTTVGNLLGDVAPPAGGTPGPADALYLTFYPFAGLALVLLLRARFPRLPTAVWLDGIIVGLGTAAVASALVLPSLVRAHPGPLAALITPLAYPLADLTLLIVLAGLAGATGLRLDRGLRWLAGALLLTLLADTGYLVLTLNHHYRAGDPLDLLWLLAAATAALAARAAPDPRTGRHATSVPDPVPVGGLRAVALPTLAQLAAVSVLLTGLGSFLSAGRGSSRRGLHHRRQRPHRPDRPTAAGAGRSPPARPHRPADRPGQPPWPARGGHHHPHRSRLPAPGRPRPRSRRVQARQRHPRARRRRRPPDRDRPSAPDPDPPQRRPGPPRRRRVRPPASHDRPARGGPARPPPAPRPRPTRAAWSRTPTLRTRQHRCGLDDPRDQPARRAARRRPGHVPGQARRVRGRRRQPPRHGAAPRPGRRC